MELKAEKREVFGRKFGTLRKKGFIPAELYGRGFANLHLSVPEREFRRVFKAAGENQVVDLMIDGERQTVLIHDVGEDFLNGIITHIDFYRIRMDEKVRVKVPLEFAGAAPAVKEKDAVLVKAMHEIEVEAMPAAIPSALTIDLSVLKEIGDSVYVKDLTVPADVKLSAPPETVIATATAPIAEEAAAAAPAPEEVVVESEEKRGKKLAEKETAGGQS